MPTPRANTAASGCISGGQTLTAGEQDSWSTWSSL